MGWDWSAYGAQISQGAIQTADWSNPVIIGAAASFATVVVTRVIDLYIANRKARQDFRHSDRELLSADEKDFRLTIIRQLQQCNDAGAIKDKELIRYQEANVSLIAENKHLAWDRDRLAAEKAEVEAEVAQLQNENAVLRMRIAEILERGVEVVEQVKQNVDESLNVVRAAAEQAVAEVSKPKGEGK